MKFEAPRIEACVWDMRSRIDKLLLRFWAKLVAAPVDLTHYRAMCPSMESVLASQAAHLDTADASAGHGLVSLGRSRCSPRRSASGSPSTPTCGACDPVWLSCSVVIRRCRPGCQLTTPTTRRWAVLRVLVWRWKGGRSVLDSSRKSPSEKLHTVARADGCGACTVLSSMAEGRPAATRHVCLTSTAQQSASTPSGGQSHAEV